jgi:ribulose 1,5-bisphosphate synthetase/thiazole synthase
MSETPVAPQTLREPARDLPVAGDYDVIVVGGGTSGAPAAIAAAREGARVALFERYGFCGGVAAYSIMPCWHMMSGNHSGLLTEFAQRVADFGQGPNPFVHREHMEPETVKIVILQMLEEAGVEIHLHNYLAAVMREGDRVRAIVTESKSGRRAFTARAFVDATGDGDLAAMAGAAYTKGRNGQLQGMTLRFRIGHIDFGRYFDEWVLRRPDLYTAHPPAYVRRCRELALANQPFYLGAFFDPFFAEHLGTYPDLPQHSYFNTSSIRPHELSVNATRIYGVDGTVEEDLTRAELLTRRQAYAIWRCVRDHVPGFEGSMIVDVAAQIGVRQTRTILADHVLTEEDFRRRQEWEDSVMTSQIGFDAHDVDRYLIDVLRGVVDVPYATFLTRGLSNLTVVGRAISSDHVANSSIRKQESVFQTGQVGGTAAAMAALAGHGNLRALDYRDLQERLRARGMKTSLEHRYEDREEVMGFTRAEWQAARRPKLFAGSPTGGDGDAGRSGCAHRRSVDPVSLHQ